MLGSYLKAVAIGLIPCLIGLGVNMSLGEPLFSAAWADEAHKRQGPQMGTLQDTASGKTLISGRLKAADGGRLQGILLIEKGELYNKNYQYGALVDNRGRFSVEVPEGGAYGLHFYATGYIYLPPPVEIHGGKNNRFDFSLPPNPAPDDAPVIQEVNFKRDGAQVKFEVDVFDPNENLSHQVLALNADTQRGFILDPERFVVPFLQKNYPNGRYTMVLNTKAQPFDPKQWYFVAADNKCYNSEVMTYPFGFGDVLAARPGENGPRASTPEEKGSRLVRGQKVFRANCSMCHLAGSKKEKVGPSLQGLFQLQRTPALGRPVSEKTIAEQIQAGGGDMPPYDHVKGRKLKDLLLYLKTL